jgi:tetratricopeptide (TPR) repeat protein
MPKRIPLYLFLLIFSVGFSQQVKFKKALDKSDFDFLDKEIMDCLRPDNQLKFTYSTTDLFEQEGKSNPPANEETVKELEKKIKADPKNGDLYYELATTYKKMRRDKEAEECMSKAIALLQEKIKKFPDSSDAYATLGAIYFSYGRYEESQDIYKTLLRLKPKDNVAPLLIPFLLMSTNKFDSASAFIMDRIQKYPDDFDSYTILPIYYFYLFMQKMNDTGAEEWIRKADTETAISIPLLEENYRKNKQNVKVEFRYHVARQILLSTVLMVKGYEDTAFSAGHIKFHLGADDIAKLDEGQKYFEECLKRKDIVNKYYPNKLLGSIYLLKNDMKKAIPHFQKAVALKSRNHRHPSGNPSEDYENLMSVYIVTGDTASYLKCLDEKIKNSDPDPQDDLRLARMKLARGKLAEAASTYSFVTENFSRDRAVIYGWLGLAHVSYLQGKMKEATAFANKAYALDKTTWEAYILYGIIAMKENDPFNAYELFGIARKLHPRQWIDDELLDKYFIKP